MLFQSFKTCKQSYNSVEFGVYVKFGEERLMALGWEEAHAATTQLRMQQSGDQYQEVNVYCSSSQERPGLSIR